MSTKKKVAIALIAVIGISLIVSVSLISIFAALNQNISSNVKVNFKPSQHVIGYVSATYSYGDNERAMTTDGRAVNNNNKKVSFSYREDLSNKKLQMQSSDLDNGMLKFASNVRVLYLSFKFENTGYSDFTAYLDVSSITKSENVKVVYYDNNGNVSSEIPEILVKNPIRNPGKSVQMYHIKIEVENSAKDAEFIGDFIWDLVAEEDQ